MEDVLSAGRRGWSGTLGWMAAPAAWLRGLGRARGAAAPLRVEARLSLGSKKSLVLVNCRGRQVLLALSGETVAPVLELAVPATPKARRNGGRR